MKTYFNTARFSAMAAALLLLGFMAFRTPERSDVRSDEQAIRSLVDKQNANQEQKLIRFTKEGIFVSGAFPRPLIGNELKPEDQQIKDKLKKERLNYKQVTHIERLVVAKAGDMAYEFGNGILDWDTTEGTHTTIHNAYLRVWRKEGKDWLVDAFFARPNKES